MAQGRVPFPIVLWNLSRQVLFVFVFQFSMFFLLNQFYHTDLQVYYSLIYFQEKGIVIIFLHERPLTSYNKVLYVLGEIWFDLTTFCQDS